MGVSFERTLTLGRQNMHVDHQLLRRAHRRQGEKLTETEARTLLETGWAEPFLRRLGATEVLSLDASDYEGATIIHDLNEPISESLGGRFTVVLDGGTLEHIFNLPVALANCAQLLAYEGHILHINPANNLLGHGFYQLSPELYWRALPAYGFEVERVLYKERHRRRWYAVADPGELGRRVTLEGGKPAQLYVVGRKVADSVGPVVQSDYETAWHDRVSPHGAGVSRRLPRPIKDALLRARGAVRLRDREGFTPADLR
jgi:hypothetical protein